MTIYKFQNGTKDYAVGILYSTHGEEVRLQSDDEPRSELYLQAANLVFMAQNLFGLHGLHPSLKEIVFSSGQDGPSSKILLTIPCAEGSYAKLQLPKVSAREVCDHKTLEPILDHPRNLYNQAVILFRSFLEDYVQGRRKQAVFDFQAEALRIGDGQPVDDEDFEDEEGGDNTVNFPQMSAR